MVRRFAALVATVACATTAACTSGRAQPLPSTTTITHTTTRVRTTTEPAPPRTETTTPVSSGPTTARVASACPWLAQQEAANQVGMRLARITVLRSGGQVVGCRFYALQHSYLHDTEHLPGPRQPAVEITTTRYASTLAAHNAFVRQAERGTNIQRQTIRSGTVGLCYQTDFYAHDKGTDWACDYALGTRVVTVRTVVTSPALNAVEVARDVARSLS